MRFISDIKFHISHFYGVFILGLCAAAWAQAPEDAIIARVNGEVLLLSQLKEAALDQDVPPSALLMGGMMSPAYRKALTQVVDELLLVQYARKQGITPNESGISRSVDEMIEELRRQMGSEERLQDFLKQHRLTLAGLRTMMTKRETKRALSSEVVARKVVVSDAAIENFRAERAVKKLPLEEVNLLQVLVPCAPADREGKRGETLKAEAARAARDAGALKDQELAGFVRRYSETHSGEGQGMALGWLDPETLVPALRQQVQSMQPGDVSPPIETDLGYHVLALMGRHTTRDLAFIAEYAKVRASILAELRRDATITLYDLQGRQIELDLSETTATTTLSGMP